MTFKELNQAVQGQFDRMQQHPLFRLDITGDEIWEAYITGFKEGEDPVFRDPNSTTHTCNHDKHFIRRYGNVVAIDSNCNVITMFDMEVKDPYVNAVENVRNLLKTGKVVDRFVETFDSLNAMPYEKVTKNSNRYQLGHQRTIKRYTPEEAAKYGKVNVDNIYEFDHFHVYLNKIDTSGSSIETLQGTYRDNKRVLERGIKEISLDTLNLVKDLISQGSLLNGDSYLHKIDEFIKLKKLYQNNWLTSPSDEWFWINAVSPYARFRNELIGTLCVELTEGMDITTACRNWNKRVDPANYMKATAPITPQMIKDAEKFIKEQGYEDAFNRRFATLDDIDVNEIIHRHDSTAVKTAGLFDSVKAVSTQHKRAEFKDVLEMPIEKFMADILPTVTSMSVYLEGRHSDNLVSLITGKQNIFNWSNPFSWTYKNNLTGVSQIKEAVKKAGGKVDGILRFSITWNEDGRSICDLDAHAYEPGYSTADETNGSIYFSNYKSPRVSPTGGQLDVDMIRPSGTGVENITWQDTSKMKEGTYVFKVHNYDDGKNSGFRAEIEANGQIHEYVYNKPVKGFIEVGAVEFKNGQFTIKDSLESTSVSKQIWNIDTNAFHKVNLMCLSPNHWGENNSGNKHYFFFLEGCKSDEALRTFHNEFLIQDLRDHRKVLEVLANTSKIEPAKEQLCGLGFNATVRDNVIVKLEGSHKRVLKITF